MTYNGTGIILKREPWRETARLYTIYTRETGKVLAIGRGTRKSTSKLAAHLEPFSVSELLFAHGRKFETLCGAILKRSPEPLAQNDRVYTIAAFVAEAFDHFVKLGERDEPLWALLDSFYGGLPAAKETLPEYLETFLWHFMDHLGYRPKLDQCVSCENELTFGGLFLPARGMALCLTCRPEERQLVGAEPLTVGARLELLQFYETKDQQGQPGGLSVNCQSLQLGLAFLEAHLDRTLMSLPILRQALNFQPISLKVPAF